MTTILENIGYSLKIVIEMFQNGVGFQQNFPFKWLKAAPVGKRFFGKCVYNLVIVL